MAAYGDISSRKRHHRRKGETIEAARKKRGNGAWLQKASRINK